MNVNGEDHGFLKIKSGKTHLIAIFIGGTPFVAAEKAIVIPRFQ